MYMSYHYVSFKFCLFCHPTMHIAHFAAIAKILNPSRILSLSPRACGGSRSNIVLSFTRRRDPGNRQETIVEIIHWIQKKPYTYHGSPGPNRRASYKGVIHVSALVSAFNMPPTRRIPGEIARHVVDILEMRFSDFQVHGDRK